MECERLFCHAKAVSRLTAPRIKSRCAFCAEHLDEMLQSSAPYRKQPGRIVVEQIGN